jgi:glycine oxidase
VTLPRHPDLLVVGGGVIGCTAAWMLARPGRSVVLVDRGAFGGEATMAAAGVLAASSGEDEGARLALRRASLARFPALAATLADETGIDVQLERTGTLELCLDAEDETRARRRLARRRQQGFAAAWLDGAALRRAAPAANPAAGGGVLHADDARVSPARLVEALVAAARRRGAQLVPGLPLGDVDCRGGRLVRARVGGEWIAPGLVVVAAGAWSSRLRGLAPACAVVPARGQMLALRAPGRVADVVLMHRDGYLVPQPAAEVLVGATVEHGGFERAVTCAGVALLGEHVRRIAPAATSWPVVRMWAGLRPQIPGGGPWIGRHPDLENVIVATGHHRNGILLAPTTADAVAALVDGVPAPAEAAPFGVA